MFFFVSLIFIFNSAYLSIKLLFLWLSLLDFVPVVILSYFYCFYNFILSFDNFNLK